jgi:hypothetical protein
MPEFVRVLYVKLGTHRRGAARLSPAPSACSRPLDGADPSLVTLACAEGRFREIDKREWLLPASPARLGGAFRADAAVVTCRPSGGPSR